MSYSVKVDHPAFPSGHEFAIDGLGIFKNGSARKVTEEQELAYRDLTGNSVKDGLKAGYIKIEGTTELKGGGES